MAAKPTARILVLIKGLGLGGAERLIVDSLPYLDRGRFEYEFAYLLPWKDHLLPQIGAEGFRVHCLGDSRRETDAGQSAATSRRGRIDDAGSRSGGGRPEVGEAASWGRLGEAAVLGRALRNLWRLQRARGFDLIQADLPLTGVLARSVGRGQGVPVVYTEHNLQERYHPLTRWLNGWTYGWNRAVVAVSEEVAASAIRHGFGAKTRLVTVPNGVPVEAVRAEARNLGGLRKELGIPGQHRVVGTVAVFRQQKRLMDWLEVAARVVAERENVTFLLVGDGPQASAVQARARALGLGENLRLPGFRPDGRRLLGLMDTYLMTSEFEGLPMALLEAMSLGRPVVTTAVGGIPEAVEHGREGFLASVGDVDGLAAHTLRLLDEPVLRSELGQRGAQVVEKKFHTRKRVRGIEDLYLEILEARDQ